MSSVALANCITSRDSWGVRTLLEGAVDVLGCNGGGMRGSSLFITALFREMDEVRGGNLFTKAEGVVGFGTVEPEPRPPLSRAFDKLPLAVGWICLRVCCVTGVPMGCPVVPADWLARVEGNRGLGRSLAGPYDDVESGLFAYGTVGGPL